MNEADKNKAWKQIEGLLNRSFDEQRKARRWGVFFKLLTFGYLFVILILMRSNDISAPPHKGEQHTALVDISGVIAAEEQANADTIMSGLEEAFKGKNVKGIILRINSPGGSPVQSDMVFDGLLRLREANPEKKVYAVITDIGASGGYYIAAGTDAIYASDASIVGSIGVVSAKFGFVDALDKLGIERRILTSGKSKAMLDPFLEEKPEDLAHFKTLLSDVHEQFIESVMTGRGDKLDMEKEALLFSGKLWTGRQAVELGLIDGISSPGQLAKNVIGAEKIIDYSLRPDPFDAVFQRFGVSIGQALTNMMSQVTLR